MEKFLKLIYLVISTILLSACGSPANTTESISLLDIPGIMNDDLVSEETPFDLTLEYALEEAIHRREGIGKPNYNILLPIADERLRLGFEWVEQYGEDYIVEIITESMIPTLRAKNITSEEAIADAEKLLWLLRINYGAYTYYGGDEVFISLFDRIYEELAMQDQWNDLEDFSQIFHEYLFEIIADNHVIIDNRVLGDGISSDFFVGSIGFEKSKRGFRSKETGLHVIEVIGHDIDQLFRLSANIKGAFEYLPILIIPGKSELQSYDITLVYENGDQETMTLKYNDTRRKNFQPIPALTRHSNIPVINIMKMGFYHDEVTAQKFVDFADELKDEPVVIIDLRSNEGGNPQLAMQFLHKLTDEIVPSNLLFITLGNYEYLMTTYDNVLVDDPHYASIDDFKIYFCPGAAPLNDVYYLSSNLPDRLLSNEQLIILLTDRYTASAGEAFVDLSFNLTNSLVIGQNTAGVLEKSGTHASFYLPNSGVEIRFGSSLILHADGTFAEGIGYAPDIWATGDALSTALALLNNK